MLGLVLHYEIKRIIINSLNILSNCNIFVLINIATTHSSNVCYVQTSTVLFFD